ncbi:hypothetical protein [Parasitella parasitica]|uniref:Ion transport domain-containing protein n=1 Tax=Parasitella parasitica TaxID=35722 RepID=A0A0B7NJP8_9FUNG|nr:hypothetical protein [Parasitella parasitica]
MSPHLDGTDADSSFAIAVHMETAPKDVLPKYIIEKSSLIDISANKKWIAYITEDTSHDSKCLTIRRLNIPNAFADVGNATTDDFSSGHSGTNSEDPKKFDITNYIKRDGQNLCYFLSVSPNGERVALSFLKMNDRGTVERKEKVHNPDTIIFEVGSDKPKRIRFKGRAVFLKNEALALINKDVLAIYDCDKRYRKIHWFNLYPLCYTVGNTSHEPIVGLESLVKTSYVHFDPRKINSLVSDAKDIIRISKHIRHNVLTTTYHDQVSRVWSITEDGVRLTSFHSMSREEIMAFSLDYKYLATFVEKNKSINIYNVKSGLVVSRLKQKEDARTELVDDEKPNDFQLYVCFCHKSQYLAMVSIVRLKKTDSANTNNALITFEVWNIAPEKSVYYDTEEIEIDWDMQNKFIQPFVYEEAKAHADDRPEFIAVYSTSVNGGMSEIKAKNLDVFRPRIFSEPDEDNSNNVWKSVDYILSRQLVARNSTNHIHELDNSLTEHDGLICFQQNIQDRSYLLRFGKNTVQLWKVASFENGSIITKEDKLIYIRAFKAPFYSFNEAYKETWTCYETDTLAETMSHFQQQGRIIISIKRDTGPGGKDNTNEYHHTEEIYLPVKYMNNLRDKSFIHEYHYLESACQALHYLWKKIQNRNKPNQRELQKENMNYIYDQTQNIVKRSIRSMRAHESKYFTTISGSNILAMLASFDVGREVLFDIIETDELPITLFSYVRSSLNEEGHVVNTRENALTVLIEEFDYDLYQLMFNRVIYHSKQLGTGCLSAVTDALIFLQERGNRDLLLLSTQKLSFLHIDRKILTILKSEVGEEMHMSTLHKDLVPDFRDLESHSTKEQVTKYNNSWLLGGWIDHVFYWWSFYIVYYFKRQFKQIWTKIITSSFITNLLKKDRKKINGSLIKLCVVPLPHFNSYSDFPEDRPHRHNVTNATNSNENANTSVIPYKAESAFISLATNQHENDIFHQGDTVLEVLLQYKWNKFARKRFLLVYLIYLTYYIAYSIGVSFPREVFGYVLGTPISNIGHLACIIIMFIAGGILFLQEVHQFAKSHSKSSYFVSLYNIIDITAFILPVVTYWQMLNDLPHLVSHFVDEVSSVSTLILWMHGILRLRVIPLFGITLETIIQLVQSVYKVLIIMLLVIVGFTNSFIVLLSHRDDSFFQEQFEGSVNLTDSGFAEENSINYHDASSSNNFGNPFKSFSMLWFFIFGVWDAINDGDAGDDYMVMVLAILYSFLTALIFFNLVIALMSSKVEEVRVRGKKVWISHFAAIVAEIEQLWCTKYENRCRKNNPTLIYYIAKTSYIKEKDEWLKDQTDVLVKQLKEDQAEKSRRSRPNYIKSVDDLKDLIKEDTDRLIEQLEKQERNATFGPTTDVVRDIKELSRKLQEDVNDLKRKLEAVNRSSSFQ